MEFKVIIAGSRNFNDYELLKEKTDKLLSNKIKEGYDITIISGGARGADKLGERYAKERGFNLIVCNADWDRYGKSAGYRRNVEMSKIGDALIAFWNGQSRGTKNMIDIMMKTKKPYRVIHF